MANSVVKLSIDNNEYDAKLKQAGRALNEYFDIVKKGDRTFEVLDEGVLEAVKAFGQMETSSKSAKGSLAELQRAFTDMSLAYRRLTDEEKASPVGKAMEQSLSELKTRIDETKGHLSEINKELGETGKEATSTGSILDQLAGKFGLSAKSLVGWGAALGAGKLALDTAKDAFFASEQNIDDWGRTVESSKMLYEGFLTALNTGDISGYLQNMGNIAQAAMDAYNELDRLGTMKTINAPSTSGRQTEITRLQGMLRSGRAVDSLTGGKSYAEDGAVLTKAQKQQVADDLKALLKESRDTAQQEINQATSAINALYKEQATVLGMNTDEFRKGTKNMQEFDKVLDGAKKYREFEQQHTTTVQTTSGTVGATYTSSVRDNAVNPYEQFKAWRDFKDDGTMYQRLIQKIQKRDQATQQFYGLVNQSYLGINRAEGISTSGGTGGRGGTTTSPQVEKEVTVQQQIAALEKEAMTATEERLEEIKKTVMALDQQLAVEKEIRDVVHGRTPVLNKPVGDKAAFEAEMMRRFQEESLSMGDELSSYGLVSTIPSVALQQQQAAYTEDESRESLAQLSNLTSSVTSINTSLNNIGVTVPEEIGKVVGSIQTVTGILSAIESIMTISEATDGLKSIPVIGGVAAMLAGLFAGAFANGGIVPKAASGYIVPGTHFSGDVTPILANAGEVVLSRSQVNNLAGDLTRQSAGGSRPMASVTINSEDLRILIRNGALSRGMTVGEYLNL